MDFTVSLVLVLIFSQVQGVLIKIGSDKILGGTPDANSIKNTAAIFNSDIQNVCSGALIHPSWILTSALCAKKTQREEMRVVIGEQFTNTTFDTAAKIQKQFIFPKFDQSRLVDDIALIQLEKPAENNVDVLKIPDNDANLNNKECIVRGYGYYEPTHILEFPGNLTQRNVRILENSFCRQYPVTMTKKKLCTTEVACNGDLGAPLITVDTNELIGLVSIEEGQTVCGFPAIPLTLYTKVVPYKNWIKSTANIDI